MHNNTGLMNLSTFLKTGTPCISKKARFPKFFFMIIQWSVIALFQQLEQEWNGYCKVGIEMDSETKMDFETTIDLSTKQ